jgi:hypothetical protein
MGSMSENNPERRERLRKLHRAIHDTSVEGLPVLSSDLMELIEIIFEDDPHLFEGQTLFETDDEARARLGLGEKAA